MTLIALIVIPIVAGLAAWPLARRRPQAARWVCVLALCAGLGMVIGMCTSRYAQASGAVTTTITTIGDSPPKAGTVPFTPDAQARGAVGIRSATGVAANAAATAPANRQSAIANRQSSSRWLWQLRLPWIPQAGIEFFVAADGLSLLLIALTYFLGIMGVLASWTGITSRVGFFHFNLMWLLAALAGVFLAMDLMLFVFFWEMMLVPLYLIIGIWGHENRIYATIKFVIFTQAGSLMMLLAILALYFIYGRASGVYTFDYTQLIGTKLSPQTAMWLMLAFLAAFAVKLPAFGLHTWLPDAHTEAPTAGSVYLAGLVLKAGAYGMLRFLLPLFPQAAIDFAPAAMTLAVIGIIYGAVCAIGQRDLKRLVAYTSVSHMGFVLLGVFAMNELALQGAVVVIVAHGLSTGALFILVGALSDRIHTRDMARLGGLWAVAPRMGGVMSFFAMASLGLPGLANFVGELLVLLGTFRVSPVFGSLAAAGLIVSVIYSLLMFQRTFHGPKVEDWRMPDLSVRECVMSAALIAATIWIGLYPRCVMELSRPATQRIARDEGVSPSRTAGVSPAGYGQGERSREGKMPSRRAGETPSTPAQAAAEVRP